MLKKLEPARLGRVVISAFLLVTLAATGANNLPDSHLKTGLMNWARPYLLVTGLDQDWGIFSPNPRPDAVYVRARTDYADGSSSEWAVPTRHGWNEYTDYRWQKFGEEIHYDNHAWMWPMFAHYLAERARTDGRRPVRVSLLRRWALTLPPGPGPQHGPRHDDTFYTVVLEGRR